MEKPVREVAVSFVRRYTMYPHTCPVCEAAFEGARVAVYCSAACRKKAQWQRGGAQWRANSKARKAQEQ